MVGGSWFVAAVRFVSQIVGAGLGGAEGRAVLAVAPPQEAAARVGVRLGRSVGVGRRTEAVDVVVGGAGGREERVTRGEARGAAEGRAVGGVALNDLVGEEWGR